MRPAESATAAGAATKVVAVRDDAASAQPAAPRRGGGAVTFVRGLPWPALCLAALAIATLVGAIVYPTFPNYDSYYSLLWGREVLDGHLPSFDAYRAPTQHPLAVAFGALLSLIGQDADRVMVWCTLASFVVLCAGVYRLGRTVFTPLVGLAAAALLCTRFDFPFLAARAYIDVPYLAFLLWAAALEAERPRRGGIVWVLLICAALLRPEAWLLCGIYFLWLSLRATWPERVRYAVLAGVGPVTWALTDFIATGDPVFSLTHTTGLAEELGRTKGLSEVPGAMQDFFFNLAKAPVVYGGIVGFGLALWFAPRRLAMPLALWLIGTLTFVMVGVAGLSVIDRYLLVPALMTMLFAAVALAGWTMLRSDGRAGLVRRAWMGLSVVVVAYGAIFTATHVQFGSFDRELDLRGATHSSLVALLDRPAVQDGRACGPVSVPNHKLVPEVRWVLDAPESGVIARSDPEQDRTERRGVALYVTERSALLRQALVERSDDVFDNIPMAGFRFVGASRHYGAYVACGGGTAGGG
ncbi:hypothetical protein [Conexibacter sp. SYSU D00693]|uniref:hypothetical protein n=1 Tax=Conexibacter sp. SYSU D00693 TaxID=2812560 RepID=UPI00196B65CE|nr:hypothetical protein [Conexibacter sp. SYSU D00693]